MPSDVLETTLAFLTGFDAFRLSHATSGWFAYLSEPSFWRWRLHGDAADPQGPPWMKELRGRSFRLKQRMSAIFQRDLGQQWKKSYVQERSVLFRGMGSREFLYRHQRGPYAYLEHNVATESRQQRPMDYFAGSKSLSFDVWLCLLPDTRTGTTTRHHGRCGGGVVYALDCDDFGDDRWQPVVVDSKYNLFCSLLEDRALVAANMEPNRWYHLALTYDQAFQLQRVYLNGKNVHSDTGARRREWSRMAYQQIGTGHISAGEGDFPYPGYNGAYDFRGLVDEFRVWQGVLSTKEIEELARGGTLASRSVWASMKLPGRKTIGSDLQWVHCTRPAEGGTVEIVREHSGKRPLRPFRHHGTMTA